jgi:uncharacterized protein (DUF4415 family)
MKKELTKEQMAEIQLIRDMPDEDIDYSDIPSISDWSVAEVGKFYRPIKQTVTIRLDADVLDWLKKGGKGYQTKVNRILRTIMEQKRKKTAA